MIVLPADPLHNSTVPGDYGHYEQDARTIASWNVDYLKMDWCVPHNPANSSQKLDMEGTTTRMAKALNATGRQIWFNFHCAHTKDHRNLPIPPWCPAAGNSYRIATDHHDFWPNTALIIEFLKLGASWSATGPNSNSSAWNE